MLKYKNYNIIFYKNYKFMKIAIVKRSFFGIFYFFEALCEEVVYINI